MMALLFGTPGAIRTRDLPLRRRTLYPAELRVHKAHIIIRKGSKFVNKIGSYSHRMLVFIHGKAGERGQLLCKQVLCGQKELCVSL